VAREDSATCHIRLKPYSSSPSIVFSHRGEFMEGGTWYYSFEYAIEEERGLDYSEDAYCPGAWVWRLDTAHPVALWAIASEETDLDGVEPSRQREIARLQALGSAHQCEPPAGNAPDAGPAAKRKSPASRKARSAGDAPTNGEAAASAFAARLGVAADQFIVTRGDHGLHTVLAGYPWFSDWGRDTAISLPGLCLATGRFEIARSILLAFGSAMSQGMIPNRFPDSGETPEYNTVDATLWYFVAVARYILASSDWGILDRLYQPLVESIDWHLRGTRFGILADSADGMLRSGEPGTQLTWMDAKVGDWVVTPRCGKPVEIQALWYNALRAMMDFADNRGDAATKKLCGDWSRKLKSRFTAAFWNADDHCLYDCIDGDRRDGSIRPNQIFALSLPHRLLTSELEKQVLATVQRELLTPYGLRTLSPRDAAYRGIYCGDQHARDGAYHQGTVWAWLIGPFLSAYLAINRHTPAARAQALAWLAPLQAHLDAACLGSISEIFDGDAPHAPRGCYAQAWSVAEPLRVLAEMAQQSPTPAPKKPPSL
jgi:glycogen debranching enzyme